MSRAIGARPSENSGVTLAARADGPIVSADAILTEVTRLYQVLKTAGPQSRLACEAEIRQYAERYWALETIAGGDPILGKLGPGRRRPYLVLAK